MPLTIADANQIRRLAADGTRSMEAIATKVGFGRTAVRRVLTGEWEQAKAAAEQRRNERKNLRVRNPISGENTDFCAIRAAAKAALENKLAHKREQLTAGAGQNL